MPRVDSAQYDYIDQNGARQVLRVPYDVNAEGVFTTMVPEWLVENVKALRNAEPRWHSVSMQQLPKNFRIAGGQLAPLKSLIEAALREFSAPEVHTELVIRYAITTEAAAWELPDGRLAANGRVGEQIWRDSPSESNSCNTASAGADGYGAWPKELRSIHATKSARGGYMTRVGAVVQRKVTTTRGQAIKVEYQPIYDATATEDPAIWRLNSFVGMGMDDTVRSPFDGSFHSQEMPYSPEAADFFYSVILGVAQLALRLERFFGDQATLIAHIQKGTPLLGVSPRESATES